MGRRLCDWWKYVSVANIRIKVAQLCFGPAVKPSTARARVDSERSREMAGIYWTLEGAAEVGVRLKRCSS